MKLFFQVLFCITATFALMGGLACIVYRCFNGSPYYHPVYTYMDGTTIYYSGPERVTARCDYPDRMEMWIGDGDSRIIITRKAP